MSKPYTHKIEGSFTKDFNNIALDLTIENPKFKISSVEYNWDNDKCNIEVQFQTQQGNILSRFFSFTCNEVWDDKRSLTEILSLPEFENAETIN